MSAPERITLSVDAEALRAFVAEEVARQLAEHLPAELLTTEEAARYLRTTPRGIHDRVSRGTLPAEKDGGRNLYRRADLDAYLSRTRPC